MQEIINKNIIIEKIKMPKKEAIDIFKSYKMQDKVDLLHWVQEDYVNLN